MDANLNREIEILEREAVADETAELAYENELLNEGTENDINNVPIDSEPDQEIIAVLDQVVTIACSGLAPAWNIQPEETQIVAQAFERVLNKYMPNAKDSLGCEFALVLAVGGIILPRLSMPRFEEPEQAQITKTEPREAVKAVQPNHVPMNGEVIDLGGGK